MKKLLFLILFYVSCYRLDSQSFNDVTLPLGINHQYSGGEYGGGISFRDFDMDGWDDISFAQNGGPPKFFKNVNGVFSTIPLFITNQFEMKQLSWVDYDNDGDRDIFTSCVGGPFRLYNNNGSMVFTDVSSSAGFPTLNSMGYGNSWGDYDRDGDLDVYISNYNGPGMGDTAIGSMFFRNNGDGTFTDQTIAAGLDNTASDYTFMALWVDYNKDFWPDLMIGNDRTVTQNYLYKNNGDGTFDDVTVQAGMNDFIWTMSNTADDYDNDGDLDFYFSNGPLGNLFKQNSGDGTFTNISEENGTELNLFCWGAQFMDADNDTWQDLHVCATPITQTPGQNQFMKNVSGSYFVNQTAEAGLSTDTGWSRGSAIGDINNDGYPDFAVQKTAPDFSRLWLNAGGGNNWLKVKLQGTESNREGVSSWIECYAGGHHYTRYTYCNEAYLCQNSDNEFFGLANMNIVDSLVVSWTSGIVDTWYNIPANQDLYLVEGTSRRVEVTHSSDLSLCENDSLQLIVNDWQSYNWSNGHSENSLTVNASLVAYVLVSDEYNNLFLSDTLSIVQYSAPDVNPIVLNPLCHGENTGYIELSGVFEVPSLTISWNEVAQNGLSISSLVAGDYYYHFHDEYGCEAQGLVQLFDPQPLVASSSVKDAICFGINSGMVTLLIEGGTPGYHIQWGELDSLALAANSYAITVSDAHQCETLVEFEVHSPAELSGSIMTHDVLCNGEATGSVEVTASGGTGSIAIIYPGYEPSAIAAGDYDFLLKDENLCEKEFSFTIQEPELLLSDVVVNPQVENGEQGSAQIVVIGGTAPYSWEWSNGIIGDPAIAELEAGDYYVLVSDAQGCSDSISFHIDFIEGIHERNLEDVLIFPNPVWNSLRIVTSMNKGEIRIYDSAGSMVSSGLFNTQNTSIRTEILSPGLYTIVIESEGKMVSRKFVKE